MKSNTLADTQKYQRIHRLVQEFKTLKWYALFYLLMLFYLSYGALKFWYDDASNTSGFESLSLFGIIGVLILAPLRTFKEDDMKDPQAFWITRPIRQNVMFKTKLTALHLYLTLPTFLVTVVTLLFIISPLRAFIYAIEISLWIACSIHLLAFGALNVLGYKRSFFLPFAFFVGMVLGSFFCRYYQLIVGSEIQIMANFLIILVVLVVLFWLGIRYLLNNPQLRIGSYKLIIGGFITVCVLFNVKFMPIDGWSVRMDKIASAEPLKFKQSGKFSSGDQYFQSLSYYLPISRLEKKHKRFLWGRENIVLVLKNGKKLRVETSITNRNSIHMLRLKVLIPSDRNISQDGRLENLSTTIETISGQATLSVCERDNFFEISDDIDADRLIHGDTKYTVHPHTKGKEREVSARRFDLPLLSSFFVGGNKVQDHHNDYEIGYYSSVTQRWVDCSKTGFSKESLFGRILTKKVDMQQDSDFSLREHWKILKESSKTDLNFKEWKNTIKSEINLGCYVPVNEEIVVIPFEVEIELPMVPQIFEE